MSWLILDDARAESIEPGESRVGTPEEEFFIGIIGQLQELDPATLNTDFINWEIMRNTMSGLYMFDTDNELQPVLAADFPADLRGQARIHHPPKTWFTVSRRHEFDG